MSIQRYGFNAMCDGESGRCLEDMIKDDDGDYVLYTDHVTVVERLKAGAVWVTFREAIDAARAHEREECAKVCEAYDSNVANAVRSIRARGES